jgi:hypothetical protein
MATQASPPRDALVDVMLRAGHTQVAAMTAASRLLASWAATADRYAQALGTEICDRSGGRTPAGQAAPPFPDGTSAQRRALTELPRGPAKPM